MLKIRLSTPSGLESDTAWLDADIVDDHSEVMLYVLLRHLSVVLDAIKYGVDTSRPVLL